MTVKSRSYTLRTEHGGWLGQVVLTQDGMFAAVTDWGNLSYKWPSSGTEDFRDFIIRLNVEYFGSKLQNGLSYIAYSKTTDKACNRFAEKILPVLQEALKRDIILNEEW